MRRIWLSLGILLLLIGGCAGSVWSVQVECKRVSNVLDEIAEAIEEDRPALAVSTAIGLQDNWQHTARILNVQVQSGKVQALETELARLTPLIEADREEVDAQLAALHTALDQIAAGARPTWDVVF